MINWILPTIDQYLSRLQFAVMERIILKRINSHLQLYKIINPNQFGFLKNHSTTTQLLSSFNEWYKAILDNNCIDCIYIDYKKAFDSVPIKFLLYKLSNIEIKGKLLRWISEFLTNRSAKVRIKDKFSHSFLILSGVPQGSILGPVLFLIYINDLPTILPESIHVRLYADDLKIFHIYKKLGDTKDLQLAFNKVITWSSSWALKISPSKTLVFHIGN